ncbi:MAG: WD40/YVTN/BNR-like repeat-containing protein, partial [Nitrospinota bacterium]
MAYDPRDGGSVFAAVNSIIWGPEIHRSTDLGKTWRSSSQGPRFARGDLTVKRVWHVEPGRPGEAGTVFAGVEPAALFKSEDGGDTWTEVTGLTGHPTREKWQPGLGGLCLHSIV